MTRKLLKVLNGETIFPPPIWIMRQAGRYLPEYKKIKKQAKNFLELCYSPNLVTEITLQPIRRFHFDAAILFSDILVIPHALGYDVRFEEGHSPFISPIKAEDIFQIETKDVAKRLEPVYESIRLSRSELPNETTLLGFCGAPWTVATYMTGGGGTYDKAKTRLFAYQYPAAFSKLLNDLADISADYLIEQLNAGVDAVQIFDSWAGILDEICFERFCIIPVIRIVQRVRAIHPKALIIGFPKGAGALYTHYCARTSVNAVGLDWSVPLSFASSLQKQNAVQGNLDPLRLSVGGTVLNEGIDDILNILGNGPLIFNLGHGIMPDTPIKHVEQMVNRIRNGGAV